MDVKLQWDASTGLDGLVARLEECKQQLLGVARQKHNLQRVGVEQCIAYAGDKLLQLLQCSDGWVPYCEMTEEDLTTPLWRREQKASYRVATLGGFELHRWPVLGKHDVRVIVLLEVGEDAPCTFYGNVSLGDQA